MARRMFARSLFAVFTLSLSLPSNAAADVILNPFESAGDISAWAWGNPSVCALLNSCGGAAGPCINLIGTANDSSVGAKSGMVRLQNDSVDTDCNGNSCGPYRKMTMNVGTNNWSAGYTRITFDARNWGQVAVGAGLAVSDGTLTGSPDFTNLPVGGGWTTISIQIQDLVEAGFNLSNMTQAIIQFNTPSECATVFVDNLRLVSGVPPNPPTAVTVMPTGISGMLTVSWTPPVGGCDHYAVYWDTLNFSNVRFASNSDLAVAGTPYTITGLTDGTTYYVKVVAIALNGDRSAAAPASPGFVKGTPICMAGANPSAFSVTDRIRVMWGLVPGATNYKVYRGAGAGSLSCPVNPANLIADLGNVSFYDDMKAPDSLTYCYMVVPYTGPCVGECSNSACVTHNGAGCAPPAAIGPLRLSVTTTGVVVGWDRPLPGIPALDRYIVIRDYAASMGPVLDTGVSSYSLTDTGLVVTGNYCYQAVALQAGGGTCSSYSPSSCIPALIPPQGPTIYPCADRIRITFSPPPNNLIGAQYKVYRMNASDTCANFKTLGIATVMTSTPIYFDDFGVVDGNTYHYRMTSVNGIYESDCTPELSAKFQAGIGSCPCMKPGVPTTLTLIPGADRARIVWSRPAMGENPLNQYRILQGLSPVGPWVSVGTVPDTGPGSTYYTYTPTGLTNDNTYCFNIVSEDTIGCSMYSSSVCTPLVCRPITLREPVAVTAVTGTDLVIAWATPYTDALGAPIASYAVWHSPFAGGTYTQVSGVIPHSAVPEFSYTHTGQDLTQTHCYKIQVLDGASPSSCTVFTAEKCRNCLGPAVFGINAITAMPGSYSRNLALTWTKPSPGDMPINRYQIRRSTASILGPWSIAGTIYEPDPAFFVDTLPGTLPLVNQVFYEMSAVDTGGCSMYCGAQSHSCAGIDATAFMPVASSWTVTGGLMQVAWGAAVPAELPVSNYEIWRSTVPGGVRSLRTKVYPPASLVFWDSPPAQTQWNQQYCWELAAIEETGCSIYSGSACYNCSPPSWVNCQPFGDPPAGNLDNVAFSSTIILVSWNRAADGDTNVSKYFLYRSSVSCGTAIIAATVWSDGADFPASATCNGPVPVRFSVTDSGLESGVTYFYKVMAVSKTGCTEMTASCLAAATKSCHPAWAPCWEAFGAPPALNTDSTMISSTIMLVSWNKAVDSDTMISRYLVYRGTSCSTGTFLVATVWSDGVAFPNAPCGVDPVRFSYTDSGLAESTSYSYRIMALSMTGCTQLSQSCLTFTTKGGCAFTSTPEITALPSSAVIKWQIQYTGTVSGYEVWRSGASTGNTTNGKSRIASLPATSLSYTDVGLGAGASYCYVIVLNVNPSCSTFSDEVCLDTLKLTAYPNPAKLSEGPVRFDGLAAGNIVEVYTVTGELIKKYTASSAGLWAWDGKNDSGSTIAGGIYLYLIRDGNKVTKRGKLVINR